MSPIFIEIYLKVVASKLEISLSDKYDSFIYENLKSDGRLSSVPLQTVR